LDGGHHLASFDLYSKPTTLDCPAVQRPVQMAEKAIEIGMAFARRTSVSLNGSFLIFPLFGRKKINPCNFNCCLCE